MSERFAVLDDLVRAEEEGERTRVFEGTGTAFLPVPQLGRLEGVRIGAMELPLIEKRLYAVDGRQGTEEIEEPLVEVQQGGDGVPVLVRANISNDGIWPAGAKIYVSGEWVDDEAAAAKADAPAADEVVTSDVVATSTVENATGDKRNRR